MNPIDQVNEIIRILSPQDTNQTDAVFLVRQYIEKIENSRKKDRKTIDRLTAELDDARTSLHNVVNDKLKGDEKRINEIAELRKNQKPEEKVEESVQAPIGQGEGGRKPKDT